MVEISINDVFNRYYAQNNIKYINIIYILLKFNTLHLIIIIISFQKVLVLKEIIYLLYMTINIIIAINNTIYIQYITPVYLHINYN